MSVKNLQNSPLKIGIIGAGPAGSMAAYLLSKAGHHVQVLERKRSIQRNVCGEYLCPKGVELLGRLNLLNPLTSDFLPLYGMVLASPEDEVITSYFPDTQKRNKGSHLTVPSLTSDW